MFIGDFENLKHISENLEGFMHVPCMGPGMTWEGSNFPSPAYLEALLKQDVNSKARWKLPGKTLKIGSKTHTEPLRRNPRRRWFKKFKETSVQTLADNYANGEDFRSHT